jgi:predicted signal transduction protein with EAL and GGDEF domain
LIARALNSGLVLESLAHVEDAAAVAQKVLAALALPFIEANQRFGLTCSIGISFFLLNGTDAKSLLDHADRAMYRAKQLGGNRYSQCMQDLGTPAQDRFHLVFALQAALERQEFRLYFQPQVDLVSGRVQGVEALLRWQHPEQGLIGPQSFIAVAEDSVSIEPLDAWVLRNASAQLKRWQDAGLPPLRMAINLSARQLIRPGLSALVATVLEEAGLRPEQLELELEEAALIHDYTASAATLAELKELGIQVALDDFGNGGASAIGYLRRLPVDVIKLDRTLSRRPAARAPNRSSRTRSRSSLTAWRSRWSPKASRPRRSCLFCMRPAATPYRAISSAHRSTPTA